MSRKHIYEIPLTIVVTESDNLHHSINVSDRGLEIVAVEADGSSHSKNILEQELKREMLVSFGSSDSVNGGYTVRAFITSSANLIPVDYEEEE